MSDAADMEARSPSSQEGAEEELQHIANHLLTIFARFFDDNQQPMAASFFTFVRACRILDEETTLYEAEAVLEALDTLEVDDPYTTISYEEFYTLLSTLAALKCPADSQASSLHEFLSGYVLPVAERGAIVPDYPPALVDGSVVHALNELREGTSVLFSRYAQVARGRGGRRLGRAVDEKALRAFAADCRVLPDHLGTEDFVNFVRRAAVCGGAFRTASGGDSEEEDGCDGRPLRLSVVGFADLFALLAMEYAASTGRGERQPSPAAALRAFADYVDPGHEIFPAAGAGGPQSPQASGAGGEGVGEAASRAAAGQEGGSGAARDAPSAFSQTPSDQSAGGDGAVPPSSLASRALQAASPSEEESGGDMLSTRWISDAAAAVAASDALFSAAARPTAAADRARHHTSEIRPLFLAYALDEDRWLEDDAPPPSDGSRGPAGGSAVAAARLSLPAFLKLLRDCSLLGPRMSLADAFTIFDVFCAEEEEEGSPGLSLASFVSALGSVASLLTGASVGAPSALRQMLTRHVRPLVRHVRRTRARRRLVAALQKQAAGGGVRSLQARALLGTLTLEGPVATDAGGPDHGAHLASALEAAGAVDAASNAVVAAAGGDATHASAMLEQTSGAGVAGGGEEGNVARTLLACGDHPLRAVYTAEVVALLRAHMPQLTRLYGHYTTRWVAWRGGGDLVGDGEGRPPFVPCDDRSKGAFPALDADAWTRFCCDYRIHSLLGDDAIAACFARCPAPKGSSTLHRLVLLSSASAPASPEAGAGGNGVGSNGNGGAFSSRPASAAAAAAGGDGESSSADDTGSNLPYFVGLESSPSGAHSTSARARTPLRTGMVSQQQAHLRRQEAGVAAIATERAAAAVAGAEHSPERVTKAELAVPLLFPDAVEALVLVALAAFGHRAGVGSCLAALFAHMDPAGSLFDPSLSQRALAVARDPTAVPKLITDAGSDGEGQGEGQEGTGADGTAGRGQMTEQEQEQEEERKWREGEDGRAYDRGHGDAMRDAALRTPSLHTVGGATALFDRLFARQTGYGGVDRRAVAHGASTRLTVPTPGAAMHESAFLLLLADLDVLGTRVTLVTARLVARWAAGPPVRGRRQGRGSKATHGAAGALCASLALRRCSLASPLPLPGDGGEACSLDRDAFLQAVRYIALLFSAETQVDQALISLAAHVVPRLNRTEASSDSAMVAACSPAVGDELAVMARTLRILFLRFLPDRADRRLGAGGGERAASDGEGSGERENEGKDGEEEENDEEEEEEEEEDEEDEEEEEDRSQAARVARRRHASVQPRGLAGRWARVLAACARLVGAGHEGESPRATDPTTAAYWRVCGQGARLPRSAALRLLHDLGVYPGVVGAREAAACVDEAAAPGEEGEGRGGVSLSALEEVVVRIAVRQRGAAKLPHAASLPLRTPDHGGEKGSHAPSLLMLSPAERATEASHHIASRAHVPALLRALRRSVDPAGSLFPAPTAPSGGSRQRRPDRRRPLGARVERVLAAVAAGQEGEPRTLQLAGEAVPVLEGALQLGGDAAVQSEAGGDGSSASARSDGAVNEETGSEGGGSADGESEADLRVGEVPWASADGAGGCHLTLAAHTTPVASGTTMLLPAPPSSGTEAVAGPGSPGQEAAASGHSRSLLPGLDLGGMTAVFAACFDGADSGQLARPAPVGISRGPGGPRSPHGPVSPLGRGAPAGRQLLTASQWLRFVHDAGLLRPSFSEADALHVFCAHASPEETDEEGGEEEEEVKGETDALATTARSAGGVPGPGTPPRHARSTAASAARRDGRWQWPVAACDLMLGFAGFSRAATALSSRILRVGPRDAPMALRQRLVWRRSQLRRRSVPASLSDEAWRCARDGSVQAGATKPDVAAAHAIEAALGPFAASPLLARLRAGLGQALQRLFARYAAVRPASGSGGADRGSGSGSGQREDLGEEALVVEAPALWQMVQDTGLAAAARLNEASVRAVAQRVAADEWSGGVESSQAVALTLPQAIEALCRVTQLGAPSLAASYGAGALSNADHGERLLALLLSATGTPARVVRGSMPGLPRWAPAAAFVVGSCEHTGAPWVSATTLVEAAWRDAGVALALAAAAMDPRGRVFRAHTRASNAAQAALRGARHVMERRALEESRRPDTLAASAAGLDASLVALSAGSSGNATGGGGGGGSGEGHRVAALRARLAALDPEGKGRIPLEEAAPSLAAAGVRMAEGAAEALVALLEPAEDGTVAYDMLLDAARVQDRTEGAGGAGRPGLGTILGGLGDSDAQTRGGEPLSVLPEHEAAALRPADVVSVATHRVAVLVREGRLGNVDALFSLYATARRASPVSPSVAHAAAAAAAATAGGSQGVWGSGAALRSPTPTLYLGADAFLRLCRDAALLGNRIPYADALGAFDHFAAAPPASRGGGAAVLSLAAFAQLFASAVVGPHALRLSLAGHSEAAVAAADKRVLGAVSTTTAAVRARADGPDGAEDAVGHVMEDRAARALLAVSRVSQARESLGALSEAANQCLSAAVVRALASQEVSLRRAFLRFALTPPAAAGTSLHALQQRPDDDAAAGESASGEHAPAALRRLAADDDGWPMPWSALHGEQQALVQAWQEVGTRGAAIPPAQFVALLEAGGMSPALLSDSDALACVELVTLLPRLAAAHPAALVTAGVRAGGGGGGRASQQRRAAAAASRGYPTSANRQVQGAAYGAGDSGRRELQQEVLEQEMGRASRRVQARHGADGSGRGRYRGARQEAGAPQPRDALLVYLAQDGPLAEMEWSASEARLAHAPSLAQKLWRRSLQFPHMLEALAIAGDRTFAGQAAGVYAEAITRATDAERATLLLQLLQEVSELLTPRDGDATPQRWTGSAPAPAPTPADHPRRDVRARSHDDSAAAQVSDHDAMAQAAMLVGPSASTPAAGKPRPAPLQSRLAQILAPIAPERHGARSEGRSRAAPGADTASRRSGEGSPQPEAFHFPSGPSAQAAPTDPDRLSGASAIRAPPTTPVSVRAGTPSLPTVSSREGHVTGAPQAPHTRAFRPSSAPVGGRRRATYWARSSDRSSPPEGGGGPGSVRRREPRAVRGGAQALSLLERLMEPAVVEEQMEAGATLKKAMGGGKALSGQEFTRLIVSLSERVTAAAAAEGMPARAFSEEDARAVLQAVAGSEAKAGDGAAVSQPRLGEAVARVAFAMLPNQAWDQREGDAGRMRMCFKALEDVVDA